MAKSYQAALQTKPQEDRFLDSSLYTNPESLSLEKEYIFRRTWLYVGDSNRLSQPGSVAMTEVAESSILLVRTLENTLKVFHNVCPHRASLLCTKSGIHQLKQFVCPYHAWAFNLEGELVGTPASEDFPDSFCKADFSLKPLRYETWQKFIFVCFDDRAPTLQEFLGEIPVSLAKHCTAKTKLLVEKQYHVACNWKNFHDNTLCDYHLPMVHPNTLHPIQGPSRFYEHHFSDYVTLLYTPTTAQWRAEHQVLDELSDRARFGFFTYGIFPNLHLIALPHGMLAWLRIDPLTIDTCQVNLKIYGIPGITPNPAELAESFEVTIQEDIAITESVQRGYATDVYTPGIAHNLEARIIHQQKLIRSFLLAGLEQKDSD